MTGVPEGGLSCRGVGWPELELTIKRETYEEVTLGARSHCHALQRQNFEKN